jgi:hypothetical protein
MSTIGFPKTTLAILRINIVMALATLSEYTLAEIQEVRNSSSNVEPGKKSHKSFC